MNQLYMQFRFKTAVSIPNSPHGPVGSRPDLLQVPVPLRDLPGGSVHLLPVESRPGPHSHPAPPPLVTGRG